MLQSILSCIGLNLSSRLIIHRPSSLSLKKCFGLKIWDILDCFWRNILYWVLHQAKLQFMNTKTLKGRGEFFLREKCHSYRCRQFGSQLICHWIWEKWVSLLFLPISANFILCRCKPSLQSSTTQELWSSHHLFASCRSCSLSFSFSLSSPQDCASVLVWLHS